MNRRLILSIIIYSIFGLFSQALAMQPSRGGERSLNKFQEIGLTKMAEEGWCPGMARAPQERSIESLTVYSLPTCIPSGRCDGSCCQAPINYKPLEVISTPVVVDEPQAEEIPQDLKDQQEAEKQVREVLKLLVSTSTFKKAFKSVGKSQTIEIVKTAIDESSDSDTDSSASIGSPHVSWEEELIECLVEKNANSNKNKRTKSL